METTYLPYRRAQDRLVHYQTRPMIVTVRGSRQVLTPVDTRFLLGELGQLPEGRWPQAASIRQKMVVGLTRGWPVPVTDAEERVLLRAVEGVRVRHPGSTGLRSLRDALVRASGTLG